MDFAAVVKAGPPNTAMISGMWLYGPVSLLFRIKHKKAWKSFVGV